MNPALTAPILAITNGIAFDVGQSVALSSRVTGGTSTYNYKITFSNTINNNIYNLPYNGQPDSITETFIAANSEIGTTQADVAITDSASTPVTVTSSPQTTISINAAPTITLTPSNAVADSGQLEAFTVKVTGGTGPFQVQLYNTTSGTAVPMATPANIVVSSPGGSETFAVFTVNSPINGNVFSYKAVATDMGTSNPYGFNSTPVHMYLIELMS